MKCGPFPMWPAFPTSEYYDPLRLPLDHPSHFPGSPVIGQASLPSPADDGAETALPGSQDDRPHVQRPIRRRVPQRPLLEPRALSMAFAVLATGSAPSFPARRRDRLTTLTQASLTLQTARSLRPASHPTSRPRTGASLPGTQASPRTGLTPAGHRELIAPTSCGSSFSSWRRSSPGARKHKSSSEPAGGGATGIGQRRRPDPRRRTSLELVETSSRWPAARPALGGFRSACVTSHAGDTRRRCWSGRPNLSSELKLRGETPPSPNERQRDVGGCLPDLS